LEIMFLDELNCNNRTHNFGETRNFSSILFSEPQEFFLLRVVKTPDRARDCQIGEDALSIHFNPVYSLQGWFSLPNGRNW
jgi:hypothetical protein